MNLQSKSVEEEMIEFFIGDWSNSGHVSPGPFGPGGPTTGKTSYYWDMRGKWLLYVGRLELLAMEGYEVHGGVAFNGRVGKYDAYVINSLGNLLVYQGEWTDDAALVFTLVYPKSQRRARVVYRKLPAGSFKMTAENASEEGKFVPYFEIVFDRA